MRVLVTAASRCGSTSEIAQSIGDVLESRGLVVAVCSPGELSSISESDAVVLGSAVYMGHWLEPAVGLAMRIGVELTGRPVWLFSSGPVGDPSKKFAQQMRVDAVEIPAVRKATGARQHTIFAGKLDRHNVRGPQRIGLSLFLGLEGDFRDWDAIRAWAGSIADELLAARAA